MSMELPYLGLTPKMFDGAFQCGCGFATSDPNVYECPNCGRVWRERPAQPGGPAVGSKVELKCAICEHPVHTDDSLVYAGDGKLAHEECLASPEAEVPAAYMAVVKQAPANPATPGKRRNRRRKRKPAAKPQGEVARPVPGQVP